MDKTITCKKCGEEKGEEEFYWRKNGKINEYTCKKCYLAERKKYTRSEAGKAVRKKHDRTAKGKAVKKKAAKKYNGTEAGKAIKKKYAKTKKAKAANKKYAGTAKGRATAARKDATRRSKEAAEINTLTKEQWLQILKDQEHKCNGCKEPFSEEKPATEDHIIPLGEGPGRTKENMQALCGLCNVIKGRKSMEYLLKKIKEQKEE